MVKQPTHNRLSLGSIPSWPTKQLAFVQRIGHDSSKVIIEVRFLYAGPEHLREWWNLVYTSDLKSDAARITGSSPVSRTIAKGTV